MKGHDLLSTVWTTLLLFVALSSAWPWPDSFQDKIEGAVMRRQEERPTSSSENSVTDSTSESSRITSAASSSNDDSSSSASSFSGSRSGSGKSSETGKSGSSNSTSTKATKTTLVDPRLPPGGVQMITPAPIDGLQFYKVGDQITFQWNYTSLSVTPSAIDILASCAVNSATYTLASNMSVKETGALTWDTGNFPAAVTNPFPVASYTLVIHDAAKDVTAIPSAGYLGAFENFVFGMYTGQPYVPLNEFKCATCNGALSLHERQALGVILGTCMITILSFTWFANGFGVFS